MKSYPDNKKEEFILLVSGNGVLLKDVNLFKDKVDDCGCDGNPIALPTEVMKAMEAENKTENTEHKALDKESAYLNKSKGFDTKGLYGFLLGAVIGAAIMWLSTKDKKKTIIGAVAGGVLGMIIGYFIGRRGTKKLETMDKLNQIERVANNTDVETVEPGAKSDADNQGFFQLGQTYDFSIPYPVYALIYEEKTFFVAKDQKTNKKAIIKPNGKIRGKLIEVKEPAFFVPNPHTKKVERIVSQKPLPYLDLGNNIFIPLAVVDPDSMITPEEAMTFLTTGKGLENEVYVKGRYAGKRLFNLMYMPSHAVIINNKFGN
jgi:F0F1-type ATP synthase assembly protein I